MYEVIEVGQFELEKQEGGQGSHLKVSGENPFWPVFKSMKGILKLLKEGILPLKLVLKMRVVFFRAKLRDEQNSICEGYLL